MSTETLPEMDALERIIDRNARNLMVKTIGAIEVKGARLPLYALCLGADDAEAPTVGFFGGIHGLEKIGTHVLLAFLQTLMERLQWDGLLRDHLGALRIVFVPLINPGGMLQRTRCNPHGVDLMRNAPVDADQRVPFMLGGQRVSRRLPWYRGYDAMEAESAALCDFVRKEFFGRRFGIALDCHSGFGLRDRIWFPFAHSKQPIGHLPELFALHQLFSRTYPNHDYIFEPQSRQYLTHGDLWDYLYLQAAAAHPDHIFLPLTLEMGSWRWIKKRPLQLLSKTGFFNPIPEHRLQRVLRRHLIWLEFLVSAAAGWRQWLPQGTSRELHAERAAACWYHGART